MIGLVGKDIVLFNSNILYIDTLSSLGNSFK